MNRVVILKAGTDPNSEWVMHPETAAAIGLGTDKTAVIRFGSQKHAVRVQTSSEIAPESIRLSPDLIRILCIPEYPIYEVRADQGEITVGPYIGLLFGDEDAKLTPSRLDRWLVHVKEYAKLHGAVVVFALDKVDRENRLIEGYCYNPAKKYWQKGKFPYPSAIYRTIGLNTEWKNHFRSIIGDRLFNSRFFGKWDMYRWFSKEPAIKPHLPYTVLYRSPQNILEMLLKFSEIYIKPIFGLQGRGIVRMAMENKRFLLRYRESGVNQALSFNEPDQFVQYLKSRFRHGRYLIQQAIDLIQYKGGLVDFRCIVQKNQSNVWVCRAIIGRAGVKDSVVSNISSGGTALTVENILRKIFPAASEAHIAGWKHTIATFAIMVSQQLDKFGINCGTLGLDIGLDPQGQLWLIEINNRDPDPGIALDIRDTQLYYALKAGPLFYAKYLAGFPEES